MSSFLFLTPANYIALHAKPELLGNCLYIAIETAHKLCHFHVCFLSSFLQKIIKTSLFFPTFSHLSLAVEQVRMLNIEKMIL